MGAWCYNEPIFDFWDDLLQGRQCVKLMFLEVGLFFLCDEGNGNEMRCFIAVFICFTYFFIVNNSVSCIAAFNDALTDPLLYEKILSKRFNTCYRFMQ